jgi:hypothetical protein
VLLTSLSIDNLTREVPRETHALTTDKNLVV